MARKKNLLSKQYYMRYWTERLTNITLNLFKWEGLPEEINTASLERSIMLGGYAVFFKDLDKHFALRGALTGIDVYGYPTKAQPIAIGTQGYSFPEKQVGKDCVIIYANKTRSTALPLIEEYADRLSEIDLAIKLNTLAMKHPIIVKGNEQTKESFDTLLRQYDETYYQIITDKALDINSNVEAMNFGINAKEILDLLKEKETTMNEFFGVFGIAGTVEKRERIISGEMNAMMQQHAISQQQWLSTRQKACEQINSIFGLEVSCEYVMGTTGNNEDEYFNPKDSSAGIKPEGFKGGRLND